MGCQHHTYRGRPETYTLVVREITILDLVPMWRRIANRETLDDNAMRRWPALVASIFLVGFVGLAGFHVIGHLADRALSARQVIVQFDYWRPGFGPDLEKAEFQDHAMAYALYASAAAISGMEDRARVGADWLVANRFSGGGVGWGLPFAWDAFQDGSTNPASTIYGITTAIAVRGLLDVYGLTKDESYAETARLALDYYQRFYTRTQEHGFFWYSDQASDAIATYNVSSMLLGQYARAARLFGRKDYEELARRAVRDLWEKRRDTEHGTDWPYSDFANRPNDAVHAAYIVQGLLDYQAALGDGAALDGAIRYLRGFLRDGDIRLFVGHASLSAGDRNLKANAWGAGMLMFTLAEAGQVNDAALIKSLLRNYQCAPARFGRGPDCSSIVPREQAHIALGLARLEKIGR
jgi:hypothetical protein